MAGGVLGGVGVVQVRNALVPVVAGDLAGVGTRDERSRASHLDFGLKGERLVPFPVRRRDAVVHQEQGHGTRTWCNPTREARCVDRARDRVEDQAVGIRDWLGARVAGRCRQGYANRFGTRRALPPASHLTPFGSVDADLRLVVTANLVAGPFPAPTASRVLLIATGSCLVALLVAAAVRIAARRLHPAVVAPTDKDVHRFDLLAHEEAQPHGRGEEALLRGPAVFRGVVSEPSTLGDFRLVIHVCVAAMFDRRSAGNQKPGEIPVGRTHPARQSFVRQRVAGPRADKIESECVDDRLAYFGGFCRASHVTPDRRTFATTAISPFVAPAIEPRLSAAGLRRSLLLRRAKHRNNVPFRSSRP